MQDLRVAGRGLLRRPAFSIVAVLALGLGIGANTAIFSVIDAMLLRPLPFAEADRLVRLISTRDGKERRGMSAPRLAGWRDQARSFSAVAAYRGQTISIQGADGPYRVDGTVVTRNFFAVMGAHLVLGRPLSAAAAAGPEVVLGEQLWRTREGASRDIIGRSLTLNGQAYTVVGIAAEEFRYPQQAALWVSPRYAFPEHPLRPFVDPVLQGGSNFLDAVARLAPGVSLEAARAEMDAVAARVVDEDGKVGAAVVPLRDALVGETRTQLWVMFAAVALILLIACANVAHLMLARALGRQHEIAVRLALGATRVRLARLFFAESALLAVLGGAVALLIAMWGAPPLMALGPASLRGLAVSIDLRVLAFTGGVAMVTAVIFGVLPALSQQGPAGSFQERTTTSGVRGGRLRSTLVAAEVALSLVLLIGAGLLVRSLLLLSSVDPGFRRREALAAEVWLAAQSYPDPPLRARFYDRVLDELRATPGVETAGVISRLPLSRGNSTRTVTYEGDRMVDADLRVISPGYLAAIGLPLVAGRDFTRGDRSDTARVVLVNQAFARTVWPDGQAIGKQVTVTLDDKPSEIVGVVGDVRHVGLEAAPRTEIYVPMAVDPWPFMTFVVLGHGDRLAGALRQAIARVDAAVAPSKVSTLEEIIDVSLEGRRFSATVLGVLAGLALLLALIGIYGVIAFSVAQRTRELGIRSALGARPRALLALVVGQSMRPVLIGVVLGMAGAFAATRLLATLLYGVTAADPLTFVLVPLLLAATAALASLFASRRATRVDPMTALRSE